MSDSGSITDCGLWVVVGYSTHSTHKAVIISEKRNDSPLGSQVQFRPGFLVLELTGSG